MRGRWKLGLNAMPISSLRSTCHETSFFIEMLPWPSADHRQLFPTSDSFLHLFSCFQEKKINRGICFHSNIAAKLFQSKELTWLQWPTTAAILHNKVLRWFFSQNNDMFSSAGKCLHFCTETPASTDKKSGIPNIQRIPVYFVKIVRKLEEHCKTCRKCASEW